MMAEVVTDEMVSDYVAAGAICRLSELPRDAIVGALKEEGFIYRGYPEGTHELLRDVWLSGYDLARRMTVLPCGGYRIDDGHGNVLAASDALASDAEADYDVWVSGLVARACRIPRMLASAVRADRREVWLAGWDEGMVPVLNYATGNLLWTWPRNAVSPPDPGN